jgi:hypothetical protein
MNGGYKHAGLFRKFADECLSPVSTTPAKSCLPVSTTPAINLCHGFSVITGVVDTGDKFLAGDNDSSEQLSPLTTTPAINLSPVTRTRMPWRWGAVRIGES